MCKLMFLLLEFFMQIVSVEMSFQAQLLIYCKLIDHQSIESFVRKTGTIFALFFLDNIVNDQLASVDSQCFFL